MSQSITRPEEVTAASVVTDRPVAVRVRRADGGEIATWRGHVPALDGVRGLAILLVMVAHAFGRLWPTGGLDRTIAEVARSGWMGVDLFFVLSGFLITGILLDARDQPHYFRNFYMRRTLRIFPLYYGLLFGLLVVVPLLLPHVRAQQWYMTIDTNQVWFWTYMSNVLLAWENTWSATGWLGHFWSLAVEEQFYLIWPTVVLLLSPRALRRACLVIFAAAFALRLGIRLGTSHPLAAYTLMPARADTLAAGAWLAVALRTGVRLRDIRRYARWVLPFCVLAVVGMFLRRGQFHEMQFSVQTIGYSLLALGFAATIALALDAPERPSIFGRVFRTRALRTLGKYSYAMYCFHPLIQDVAARRGLTVHTFPDIAGSAVPGALAYGSIILIMTLIVSYLSWTLFESHFLRLKEHFPTRTRAVRA